VPWDKVKDRDDRFGVSTRRRERRGRELKVWRSMRMLMFVGKRKRREGWLD